MLPVRGGFEMRALGLVFVLCTAACGGSDVADAPDAPPAPDADTTCPSPPPDPCDPVLNCGCGLGEKCSRQNGVDTPACVPAGTKPPGELCGNESECAPGTVCASIGGESRCLRWCDEANPCPDGEACYISVLSTPSNVEIGTACGQTCSLLDQDCDLAPHGCYGATVHDVAEEGICTDAGTLVQGDQCDFANDCAVGFTCIDDTGGGASTCAQYCDRDAPACPGGLSCNELAGHTQTGICQ
jgi:hypothetical protein